MVVYMSRRKEKHVGQSNNCKKLKVAARHVFLKAVNA